MLSMSVEHANQLRQLIVEKHRPQPAGLANVYSLIIIYYSQCTIRQPKVIFLHMPAGKHKKIYFMRQPVPVTVFLQSTLKVLIIGDLPLVISSLADYSLVKRINYLDGKFDWNIGLYWNMDRIVEIKDVFNSASRSKMMMYRQPPPLNYLV